MEVCVIFLKVGEIDTLKEQYEADVMIKAKWREPSLDKDKDVRHFCTLSMFCYLHY